MKKTYKPFDPKVKAILIQGHYNNFIVNLKWENQKYLFPLAHDFFFFLNVSKSFSCAQNHKKPF